MKNENETEEHENRLLEEVCFLKYGENADDKEQHKVDVKVVEEEDTRGKRRNSSSQFRGIQSCGDIFGRFIFAFFKILIFLRDSKSRSKRRG